MRFWLFAQFKKLIGRFRSGGAIVLCLTRCRYPFHEDSRSFVIDGRMAAGDSGGCVAPDGGIPRGVYPGRDGGSASGFGAGLSIPPVGGRGALVINGSPEAAAIALAAILLIPFALAGLALINVGMVRARNASHMMMSSLCVIGVAAAVYFVCGFSWQGVTGGPGFALRIGGKQWDWIAGL